MPNIQPTCTWYTGCGITWEVGTQSYPRWQWCLSQAWGLQHNYSLLLPNQVDQDSVIFAAELSVMLKSEKELKGVKDSKKESKLVTHVSPARRHIICEICLKFTWKGAENERIGVEGKGKFHNLCGVARSLCDTWVTCFDSFSLSFTPFRSFSLLDLIPSSLRAYLRSVRRVFWRWVGRRLRQRRLAAQSPRYSDSRPPTAATETSTVFREPWRRTWRFADLYCFRILLNTHWVRRLLPVFHKSLRLIRCTKNFGGYFLWWTKL